MSDKCGSFGCELPAGHNAGQADVPANHRPAPCRDDCARDVTEGELAAAVWQDFGMVTDERAADDLAAHLLAAFRVNRRESVA